MIKVEILNNERLKDLEENDHFAEMSTGVTISLWALCSFKRKVSAKIKGFIPGTFQIQVYFCF